MLEILGYKTGETETKKLMHAMRLDKQAAGNGGVSGVNMSIMKNGLGMGEVEDLEDKVLEIGRINPKLNISLNQMRNEVQTLVQYLSQIQMQ